MTDMKSEHHVTRNDFFYVIQDNYDEHAEIAIPHYIELHRVLNELLLRVRGRDSSIRILDLGTGTGKTIGYLLQDFPKATAVGIDVFDEMLGHARNRLADMKDRVKLIEADFTEAELGTDFDVCVSALAIHHQSADGKQKLFRKIFNALNHDGHFLMIDWAKFESKEIQEIALDIAADHVRAAVPKASVVREWIYHWRHLNQPDSVEDMCDWLRAAGFQAAECITRHYGMSLVYAKK